MLATSVCTSMDWDKDGDVLAITQDKSGECVIPLFCGGMDA